jgi:excisionase family DNA binding protein
MENPFEQIIAKLDIITIMLERLIANRKPEYEAGKNGYVDIKEAAELLFLAKPTVYGLVSRMEIPHYKRGKRLYFSRKELEKWLEEGKRKTRKEIEQEAINYLYTRKGRKK